MSDPFDAGYFNAIVSYMDILGFADLVEETKTLPIKISEINRQLEALNRIGETARRKPKHPLQQFSFFNFSDLVVRSTSIESEMLLSDVVNWELFYLAEQQFQLLTSGVLLRGGISVGDLFASSDKRIVFGPALIRSYLLERDYAIFPRFVIDNELVSTLRAKGFIAPLNDYIGRSEDGVYFLDYFFAVCISDNILFPDIEDVRAQIASHAKSIEMIANKYRTRGEKVKQKHSWLRIYHNSTVRRIAERIGPDKLGSISGLLISEQ